MTRRWPRPAVVGGLTDDTTALERDLHRAHEGRAALRVDVPDDADVKRAVRLLADHPFFPLRHYGQDRQEDLHLR